MHSCNVLESKHRNITPEANYMALFEAEKRGEMVGCYFLNKTAPLLLPHTIKLNFHSSSNRTFDLI